MLPVRMLVRAMLVMLLIGSCLGGKQEPKDSVGADDEPTATLSSLATREPFLGPPISLSTETAAGSVATPETEEAILPVYGVNFVKPDAYDQAFYIDYLRQTRIRAIRVQVPTFSALDLEAFYEAGARVFYLRTADCVVNTDTVRQDLVYEGRLPGQWGQSIFDWIKRKEPLGRYDSSSNQDGVTILLEISNEPDFCSDWDLQTYFNGLLFVYSDLALNGHLPAHNVVYNTGHGDVRSTLTSSIMDWIYAHPQNFETPEQRNDWIRMKYNARFLQGFTTVTVPAHRQDGVWYPDSERMVGYVGLSFHAYDDLCRPDWSQNRRVQMADQLTRDAFVRYVHLNEMNVNQPNSTCTDALRSASFNDLIQHFAGRPKVPYVLSFFVANSAIHSWPNCLVDESVSCDVVDDRSQDGTVPK